MESGSRNSETTSDLVRPNRFIERYPDIATPGSLRWQLVNSSHNGLDEAGAVIRKYARPDSRRPIVFVDVPKYFSWLRDSAKAAA